jgi:hypothetical protein
MTYNLRRRELLMIYFSRLVVMLIGQKRMCNIIIFHFENIDVLFLHFPLCLLIEIIVLLSHYLLQYHFDRGVHFLILFSSIEIHDVFATRPVAGSLR